MTGDIFHFRLGKLRMHWKRKNMVRRVFRVWKISSDAIRISFLKVQRNRIIDTVRNTCVPKMLYYLISSHWQNDGILMPDRRCPRIDRWSLQKLGIFLE